MALAQNYTPFKWVEIHPGGNKWCLVPKGIENEKSSYRRAKAVIDNPKVPIRLATGKGFTPLMYMLFEKGYYDIGEMLFNKAPEDFTNEEFLEYPETIQACYPDDPEVKTWAQAQEKYASKWAEESEGDE